MVKSINLEIYLLVYGQKLIFNLGILFKPFLDRIRATKKTGSELLVRDETTPPPSLDIFQEPDILQNSIPYT